MHTYRKWYTFDMIIIIHVIIALTSIIMAGVAYIRPGSAKLKTSYAFMALTLLSGLYLVWTTPGTMLRTCMSGVAYLAVVGAITMMARQKLAAINNSSQTL